MNQLSIVAFAGTINHQEVTLVNAADLYAYLGIQTRFSDWILRRIEEYKFVLNQDFANVRKIEQVKNAYGFRSVEKTEYHITLDMAKELCMVERSEIGRAARRYFIEMEKEHRDAVPAWALSQWQAQQLRLKAAQEALLQGSPFVREVVRLVRMGLSGGEIGKLLDCGDTKVHRTRARLKAAGLLEDVPVLRNGNHKRGMEIAGQARNDGGLEIAGRARNDGWLEIAGQARNDNFGAGV